MKKGILIKVGEELQEVEPKNGETFSYEELKGFVGGLVQIVPLPDGRILICNDEGKLIGLPMNEKGTELWKEQYPIAEYPHNNDELIAGDILVCDSEMVE